MEQVKNASMFKAARLIADNCNDRTRSALLRARVDACQEAYDLFKIVPSQAHMELLIGTWTRMLIAISAVPPLGGEPTGAGRLRAPLDTTTDAPPVAPALDLARFA